MREGEGPIDYDAIDVEATKLPEDIATEEDVEATVHFAQYLASLSEQFDVVAAARHAMGATKYGPGKFLSVDTIEEALAEIVDLANYARYTFIKLRLLQDAINEIAPPEGVSTDFIKSGEFTKPRKDAQ
jgi:hypothetical protein